MKTINWIPILIGAIVILAAGYVGSPFLALHSLQEAAKSGDQDKLDELVDFPAVRANLKEEVSAWMLQSMRQDSSLATNPLAGLGLLLVPAMVDTAIDHYVTPAAISAIVNNGQVQSLNPGQTPPEASDQHSSGVRAEYRYIDIDRFKATIASEDNPGNPIGLVFERRNLFGWKLIRIDLALKQTLPTAPQTGTTSSEPTTSPEPSSGAPPEPPTVSFAKGPSFADFSTTLYKGPVVFPNFTGAAMPYADYRTRIRDAVKSGVNFAGRLAVAEFGCGTDCGMGYVTDVSTGMVYELPVGGENYPDLALVYKPNSSLLQATWGDGIATPATCTRAYFRWTGQTFVQQQKVQASGTCPDTSSNSDADAPPVVSSITHLPEHVGQCFTTRVTEVTTRLENTPGSGSAIIMADGHSNVSYDTLQGIDSAHVGDPVKLCVTDLPAHCPPGDTRGIGYSGQDLRTGLTWKAADGEHLCGGA